VASPAKSEASTYQVERGEAHADRARILELWERCGFTAGAAAAARYDWFYLHNPDGLARVYLLLDGNGALVGSVGAGVRHFVVPGNERPLRAAVLVDFVVHPAHRSMFPALLLQRVVREQELRDADLVYGLPDVKAAPVFKRLGSNLQLESGSYVRVLRSNRFATRLVGWMPAFVIAAACAIVDRMRLLAPWVISRLNGLHAEWRHELPDGLDGLWNRARTQEGHAQGIRDFRFLAWRFDPKVLGGWLVLPVRRGRGGTLEACFIGRREGEDLVVYDSLFATDDLATPLLVLALAAWRLGVQSVRVVFGGCDRTGRSLERAAYLLRDRRPCFLSWNADGAALSLGRVRSWRLTRADEDV
jgi:hypothetical protein